MNDATIDEQVERALLSYWKYRESNSLTFTKADLVGIMRDLLAGKFKEAPLPQIVPPPFEHHSLCAVCEPGSDGHDNYVLSSGREWVVRGPYKKTKREAIEAWNAAFVHKDER